MRKNKNRGYQKLRVWNDALEYYVQVCRVFRGFPYELKRVVSNMIASTDSIHRNIAEGYCRRSIREYLNFLNIALASLGESVSGLQAYRKANQLGKDDFEKLEPLPIDWRMVSSDWLQALRRSKKRGNGLTIS